jgi:hypothetical protein
MNTMDSMIDLNKEAEEKYPNKPYWIGAGDSERLYDPFLGQRTAFIAGANSKHVQAKVLQAQIDVLKNIKIAISDKNPFTLYNVAHIIHELQQQLKQLENGSND